MLLCEILLISNTLREEGHVYSGQTQMSIEDPSVGRRDVMPMNLSDRKNAVFVRDGVLWELKAWQCCKVKVVYRRVTISCMSCVL